MELKTLKDFTDDLGTCNLSASELKQEAIKWVKEFRKQSIDQLDCPHGRDTAGAKMSAFMYFFNITEEDLK